MFKVEPQFNIGDRVRCIDAKMTDNALIKGQEYIIEYANSPHGNIRVEGVSDWWSVSRFELEKIKEK